MNYFLIIALMLLGFSLSAQDSPVSSTDSVSIEEASYSLGVLLSDQLIKELDPDELDYDKISEGLEDAMNNKATVDQKQAQQNFMNYLLPIAEAKVAEQKIEAAKEQSAYFEKIAQQATIQKTDSGIYYEVLEKGSGPSPTAESTVKMHYIGTLTDGTVFDSSVERGEPAEFPVNRVIPGWQEIVPMMKVGSKWRIHIPFEMAYGDRAAAKRIPPFSTLVFEMELLEIVETAPQTPPAGE